MDFYAGILYALQGANWQRAGGKGEQPEHHSRPVEEHDEQPQFSDVDQLTARKQAFYDELERRRNNATKGELSG